MKVISLPNCRNNAVHIEASSNDSETFQLCKKRGSPSVYRRSVIRWSLRGNRLLSNRSACAHGRNVIREDRIVKDAKIGSSQQ